MYSNPLLKVAKKAVINPVSSILKRTIYRSTIRKCYDGGQERTTATILNKEEDLGLMIDGYSEVGFRLNNNVTVLGSMLIFPRSVLSWTVDDIKDVSDESLALLTIIEPKIDIIVIGTGDKMDNVSYSHHIFHFLRKCNLSVEILPTAQACPTFNFLNSEGRFVVGAMIPPKTILASDDDILRMKLRYQNLYELND
ncbi:hypothetical protein WA026_017092 [Henosepilachna vigintioctopunctata]|uniref:NADH dehydrogenase [ubiquinone] 1 alpha subcomplex assembly factor 3 n=1 Tax=Henosepilachna vigintioctopunctata TaxID=420089 RepID=A0AAW1TPN1_9CUCU